MFSEATSPTNVVITVLCAALWGALSSLGAENRIVKTIEGTSTRSIYQDGKQVTAETTKFSVKLADCNWRAELRSSIDQFKTSSEMSCDGTNIYVVACGARGTHKFGGQTKQFANVGSAYPGTMREFPAHMGPIWWAYCSSCFLSQNGLISDFMNLASKGTSTKLRYLRTAPTGTPPIIGAGASTLDSLIGGTLAELQILESSQQASDTSIPTKIRVIRWATTAPNMPKTVLEQFDLQLTGFDVVQMPISFALEFQGESLIYDYRVSGGEYVADHWLDAAERKRVLKASLQVKPTLNASLWAKLLICTVLVLPLLFLMFKGFRRKRNVDLFSKGIHEPNTKKERIT